MMREEISLLVKASSAFINFYVIYNFIILQSKSTGQTLDLMIFFLLLPYHKLQSIAEGGRKVIGHLTLWSHAWQ